MALILKLLPQSIPVVELSVVEHSVEYASKYNNLIMGLFCVVPLSIVVIARYIKGHVPDYHNYKAILLVSMALGLSFTGIVTYGLIVQIGRVQDLRDFDVSGFCSVLLSVAFAMCGNVTRYRKWGSRIALNNRFTRSSACVWKAVHNNAAAVQILGFVLISVLLSFIRGWITFALLAASVAVFAGWAYLYSYLVRNAFERRKRDHAAEMGAI
jgi:hypothetical protein